MEIRISKAPVIAMAMGMAAFGAGMIAVPANAQAATNVKTVFSWNWKNLDTTKTVADITGDGKKDQVRFVFKRDYAGQDGSSSLTVYVNGKKSYRTAKGCGGYICKAKRVVPASGRPLVYIEYTGDNSDGIYTLFRYEKGKLKKLVSNSVANGLHHPYIDSLKVKGNAIDITYSNQPYGLGYCKFTYTYKYQKGMLKLTSSTASSLVYGNEPKEKQPYLTLVTKTPFYKSPSETAEKVTLSQDSRVKLTSVRKAGKQLWFKVQSETSDETYWLKTPKKHLQDYKTYPGGTYFKEKFMAG